MYLFGLYYNIWSEAGLKGIFNIQVTFFALPVIITNNGPVVTDGCLEVIVRKRWVTILEGILEHSQIG